MLTVKQDVECKIQKAVAWEAANPGRSWAEASEYHEDEPKIYILKEMLSSPAFRNLSATALIVFMDFMAKRNLQRCGRKRSNGRRNSSTKWVCTNNGKIQYPYSEALEHGISRTRFRNAIDELQRKGFIDITHIGKGGRKPTDGTGDSTLYALDDRWREYDPAAGKSTVPPTMPREKDTRMDRGFQKYWAERKQK
jgi:hypothetical protein